MSNKIYEILKENDHILAGRFSETQEAVKLLLQKYQHNFGEYTDHSAAHSERVFGYCADLLSEEAISALNTSELYILAMACFLHDIGMCVPEKQLEKYKEHHEYLELSKKNDDFDYSNFLRNIHHEVSKDFIETEWYDLKIIDQKYAKAIALVSLGHRKVDLLNNGIYEPRTYLDDSNDFVCLPYLASILRLADELEMSTARIPDLLVDYYWPENEISQTEWAKSRSIERINVDTDNSLVIVAGKCDDLRIYNALLELCDKIQTVIQYGNRVANHYKLLCKREYSLPVNYLKNDIQTSFEFKNIRFNFDMHKITETLVGKALYNNKFVAIREALQNSIDACRHKRTLAGDAYTPVISVKVSKDSILIEDNGMGMDEYIIQNYFSKLGASFYESSELPEAFEPIAQFGIGVFSYFQLVNLIEVITRKEGSDCIHFKADKTPNTYFYFERNPTRSEVGTTLKLVLKDDVNIDSLELLEYLKHTFKLSEIPITIDTEYGNQTITKQPFLISDSTWQECIKPSKSGVIQNLKLVSIVIDEDDFEGVLGMIAAKNIGDDIPRTIDTEFSSDFRPIEVYQQGVFVTRFKSRFCKTMNGYINLKKSFPIKLDRSDFGFGTSLEQLLIPIETQLVQKCFDEYRNLQVNTSSALFMNCQLNSSGLREEHLAVVSNNVYVLLEENGINKTCTLNRAINSTDSFILLKTANIINTTPIIGAQQLKEFRLRGAFSELPVVTLHIDPWLSFGILQKFCELKGFYIEVFSDEFLSYWRVDTKRKSEFYGKRIGAWRILPFQENHLFSCVDQFANFVANANHDIIRYYTQNRNQIEASRELKDYFSSFFKSFENGIHMFTNENFKDTPLFRLSSINTNLKEINRLIGENFEVTIDDFPLWIQPKVTD